MQSTLLCYPLLAPSFTPHFTCIDRLSTVFLTSRFFQTWRCLEWFIQSQNTENMSAELIHLPFLPGTIRYCHFQIYQPFFQLIQTTLIHILVFKTLSFATAELIGNPTPGMDSQWPASWDLT